LEGVVKRLWLYRQSRFSANPHYFDEALRISLRPPVFLEPYNGQNVIVDTSDPRHAQTLTSLRIASRHRHFSSMKSSQALTQSFFGTLKSYGKLSLIGGIPGDDGLRLFPIGSGCQLERKLPTVADGHNVLAENPRSPTAVDVFLDGAVNVAIECKFTEHGIGLCNKGMDAPAGSSCLVAAAGVKYWNFVPAILNWTQSSCDGCPLKATYQLVRNLLAATIRTDGSVDPNGRVVLIYDECNPTFQAGGIGDISWQQVKTALKKPAMLQKCSWQQLVPTLCGDSELVWLRKEIQDKYGF
jgi:hypothetical protein